MALTGTDTSADLNAGELAGAVIGSGANVVKASARALSSLKGTGLVKLGLTLIVDLFSVVLRCFWATPVAASGSGIGPRGPTA
jgi:hypothetical protein